MAALRSRPAIRASTQINRSNVGRLRVAWTYDTADGSGASQTQPLVVNGVLYGITPRHKVVALDGATGKLLWRFDSGMPGRGPNRGLLVLGIRQGPADIRGRAELRVRAGRFDREADCAIRQGRPDRSAREPGARPGKAIDRRDQPGDHLSGPADRGRTDSRSASLAARGRPRLRRSDGQAAVVVPHHPASGRIRIRYLAERRVDLFRLRQQLGRHGGRPEAGDRLRPDRLGGQRLLRGGPDGRQSLREYPAGPRCQDRKAPVALPRGAATISGTGTFRRRRPWSP